MYRRPSLLLTLFFCAMAVPHWPATAATENPAALSSAHSLSEDEVQNPIRSRNQDHQNVTESDFWATERSLHIKFEGEDPLESINRKVDSFNDKIDEIALIPAYIFYNETVPKNIRSGVSNFFRNLYEPIIATSALLQGDFRNAGIATLRFGINTTAGVLGVMDVAKNFELESNWTDLGATFCHYGAPSGPYLVLPILGPTNVRKLAGRTLSLYAIYFGIGATSFYPYYTGRLLSEYIDDRPGMDFMIQGAVDPYAVRRSVFWQTEDLKCHQDLQEKKLFPEIQINYQ